MTSTVNGTAHHDGDPRISWPVDPSSHDLRPNPIGQINSGGIGRTPELALFPAISDETRSRLEQQYLPGQLKSLSGIAVRAFLLGIVLSASVLSALNLIISTNSPLWRLPTFLAILCLFHFLEFWTTAQYNTRSAQVSSYLLSQNGSAYNIAHTAAMLECLITNIFFPNRTLVPPRVSAFIIASGIAMITIGQGVRSIAMAQAGTNFNHIVQHRKTNEHKLVTSGAYYYLRHPSYFGFFWWGLGTQLLLGNVLCFLGYSFVLWKFFSRRISGEEELLVAFFGNDVSIGERGSMGSFWVWTAAELYYWRRGLAGVYWPQIFTTKVLSY